MSGRRFVIGAVLPLSRTIATSNFHSPSSMKFGLNPLSRTLGAEVTGIDLSQPLDQETEARAP